MARLWLQRIQDLRVQLESKAPSSVPSVPSIPSPPLQARYDDLTALTAQLRIIVAPHKRLHPELIAEIFYHTLKNDFSINIGGARLPTRREPGADTSKLPWKLGHICSLWRRIAVNEVRLWNRIRLDSPDVKQLPILQAVAERGGRTLQMNVFTLSDPLPVFVLPHAASLSYLRLVAPSQVLGNFMSLPPSTFPSIREISISSIRVDIPVPISQEGVCVFDTSHSHLEKVHLLFDLSSLQSIASLRLPFTQLREMSLDRISLHVAVGALEHAQILERCSFSVAEEGTQSVHSPSSFPLVHARLQQLDIRSETPALGRKVLRFLTLPSLTDLKWVYNELSSGIRTEDGPRSASELIDLLDRSSCRLRSLESNFVEDAGKLFDRLEPTIVRLVAQESTLPLPAMKRFARGDYANNLRNLSCRVHYRDSRELLNLIERRWTTQAENGREWRTEFGIHVKCRPDDDYALLRRQVSRLEERLGVKGNLAIFPTPVDNT
jgi:hypothetical protein